MENNPADLIDIDYAKISNRSRKFRQAGYGFFVLNLIYLGVAMFFIPPFNLGLTALLSLAAFILLLGLLTYYLLKEKKRFVECSRVDNKRHPLAIVILLPSNAVCAFIKRPFAKQKNFKVLATFHHKPEATAVMNGSFWFKCDRNGQGPLSFVGETLRGIDSRRA